MPRTGAAGNWEEGGLKEAVVEDFWVYYVRYAVEGRARIYGDMPEFWGSSSSLRERVCGRRYLVYADGGVNDEGVVSYSNLFS